jgi:hypothetical protein
LVLNNNDIDGQTPLHLANKWYQLRLCNCSLIMVPKLIFGASVVVSTLVVKTYLVGNLKLSKGFIEMNI